MTPSWPVFCESTELAVEASAIADDLGLAISAELSADPLDAAAHAAARAGLACALCTSIPDAAKLVAALDVCSGQRRIVLGLVGPCDAHVHGLASDLGIVCACDVAPAMSAVALLGAGVTRPFRASPRKLNVLDRARIEAALGATERGAGRLVSLGAGVLGLLQQEDSTALRLGRVRDAAQALSALAAAEPMADARLQPALPQDLSATRDVLFGPPRLLSDPASKAALAPFGLPMPQEELCGSPSRAAAEAARIGFPVRISLASPDLRVWDHPDLSVDGVDNAARVRDVYRQLTAVAQERSPEARVLGVTVTATTLARALTRVTARPLPSGRVLLRIGFADPHGAVAKDATSTVLPESERSIARALARLSAEPLLLGDSNPERERNLRTLGDLFARIGAFVDAFRTQVDRVELHPLALLVGGGAEVREAAIEVNDSFVRESAL